MRYFGKGVSSLICCLSLLIIAPITESASLDDLTWLPLLTANIKKLQPNKDCPQNRINDLSVDKKNDQINSDVRLVNWDLNCSSTDSNKSVPLSNKQKNKQVEKLLIQIANLPLFKLRFNTINLVSDLLKDKFSTSLYLKKSQTSLFSTAISDLLTLKLTLDLANNQLDLKAKIKLDKLSSYIDLTEVQRRYLKDDLILSYKSSLKKWHQGWFKIEWQGKLPDFSEQVNLSTTGNIDIFKQSITLSKLVVSAKNVTFALSEQQSWKTPYIKIKLSAPAILNYQQLKIEKLPLHLRIGPSVILTKVARGKSKRIRIDKQKLPAVFMQLSATGTKRFQRVDWELALLNQKLTGKLMADSKKLQLQIVDNQINLKTLIASSGRYINGLDLLKINQGMVKLDISAHYLRKKKITQFSSVIKSAEIAGEYDNILFDGVSFSSDLNYLINKQKKITIKQDKQQLHIKNLFVGFPIQALQIDAVVNAGKPIVEHFKAKLLSGQVDFDNFKLTAPSQTMLNITGISLAEIIKYSAYPEIQSKAIIDGLLPLSLTLEGPEITDGLIYARPPGGYIKVPENTVIKAMGEGDPSVLFTMQLLSDFQFDTMRGKVGYTSDGESDLKIEIKGISPKVSGTQPINFNYSHQENILKLLKSLRFSDQLERSIKEKY